VVEDDEDLREILHYVLAQTGLRVDVAIDGIDALHKLEADGKPPVIVLDMMLPNMDGKTFLRALSLRPVLAGAPVVAMSGSPAALREARTMGAAACLLKPFDIEKLISLVGTLARAE
jgi:CheY-like chemotaxis protein